MTTTTRPDGNATHYSYLPEAPHFIEFSAQEFRCAGALSAAGFTVSPSAAR